jgi:hypothetical protein
MMVKQQAKPKGSGLAGTVTIGPSDSEATNDKRAVRKIASADYIATAPWYTAADTLDALPMKAVKYTKEGVVIPSSWMKGWGKAVVAHRDSDVLILESPARAASRKKLARMVGKVRRAARELSITPEQITAEVAAVRRERARRS